MNALKEKIRNGYLDLLIKGAYKLNVSYEGLKNLINKRRPDIKGWVPLSEIRYFIPNQELASQFSPNRVRKPELPAFILTGDWDKEKKSIDEYYTQQSTSYRSVMQILEKGMDYRQCDEYKEKKKLIKITGHSARGKSLHELDQYFEDLIKLKNSINKNGYKTQKELGKDNGDEIGVFCGRSGELLKAEDKFCGTHRFAIAKHLDLPKVYVKIIAVHEEWARQNIQKIAERDCSGIFIQKGIQK